MEAALFGFLVGGGRGALLKKPNEILTLCTASFMKAREISAHQLLI